MLKTRLIGLLGGTFDPVHYGHLQPARLAKQQLGFDELRLLPCRQPAHRPAPIASAAQRVHMLELALQDFPELSLDCRELERDGPSYSFDSLTALHAEIPQATFCWILGFDAFQGLTEWHQWRQVLSLTHFLVVKRPGCSIELSDELVDLLARHQVSDRHALRKSPAGAVLLQELDAPNISATIIRQRLTNSESINDLVPKSVQAWLDKNPIYTKVNEK